MISIDIPGFGMLELAHLVLDYNGTLALDGRLLPGVADALCDMAGSLRIHVITADTFGLAREQLKDLPVELTITPVDGQADSKLRFVSRLGANTVVAIGNGSQRSQDVGRCGAQHCARATGGWGSRGAGNCRSQQHEHPRRARTLAQSKAPRRHAPVVKHLETPTKSRGDDLGPGLYTSSFS